MGKRGATPSDPARLVLLVRGALDGAVDPATLALIEDRLRSVVTMAKAEQRLGIKSSAIRYHVRRGTLRAFTDGISTFFLPADIEAFAALTPGGRDAETGKFVPRGADSVPVPRSG